MPQIEVLPLHTPHTRSQPGWAYVPADSTSSALPAPTATQPGNRKRAARNIPTNNAGTQQTTAKQQKAIEQRLKDLDKENYRDVHVPIPKRERGEAKAGQQQKKMTSNVRRILGYNRAFAHYLADEEAAIAAGGGGFAGTWGQGLSTSANAGTTNTTATASGRGARDQKRKSTPTAITDSPAAGKGRGRGRRRQSAADEVKKEADTPDDPAKDTAMPDADAQQSSSTTPAAAPPITAPPPPRYPPAYDADPLLRTLNLPPKPSDRVMAALLAEPPLSYAAARAKPLEEERQLPRRHFCAVCGYWGKVRCRRCGERTCGLMECWKGHEVAGCVPY
jgi:zinc finger HIT domain-containing protein 1